MDLQLDEYPLAKLLHARNNEYFEKKEHKADTIIIYETTSKIEIFTN